MDGADIQLIRTILTAIGVLVTLGAAIWVIRTNKKFKQSDVLLEFRKRYDVIRAEAKSTKSHKLDRDYYKKIWMIFHDEYISFVNGNISKDVFVLWSLNFLDSLVAAESESRLAPLNLVTSCPVPLRKMTAKQIENLPVKLVVTPPFLKFVIDLYEYRREIRYQRHSKLGLRDVEMYQIVIDDIGKLVTKHCKNPLQQIIDL